MDEESDDCLLAAAAIAIIVRRRRHTRRRVLWSRQWLVDRSSERRIQHFLDYELVDDFCGFHGFLRMSSVEFNSLLTLISPSIQRVDTEMRDAITAKEKLVLTLPNHRHLNCCV